MNETTQQTIVQALRTPRRCALSVVATEWLAARGVAVRLYPIAGAA